MNNLFNVFKIEISGSEIDNLTYTEYTDFDASDLAKPTDAEVRKKAEAYIVYKQLTRKMSELAVPTYFTIEFKTDGTASTIPVDATIHVGYVTIAPFVKSYVNQDGTMKDEDELGKDAANTIKGIVEDVFKKQYTELTQIQLTQTRNDNAVSQKVVTIKGCEIAWVETQITTPTVTVEKVKL